MASNKELIQKADIALGDLSTAGALNPEQTNRFIRTLIDTPTILNSVRTVAMTAPTMNINKIGFGSRILQVANQTVSSAFTERYLAAASKPDLAKVTLTTKEVMAEVHLPYEVLEDNIEQGRVNTSLQEGGGGLHQTIVDLLAERAALDLEELAVKGDTVSGADAYLKLADGYLKLMTSNTVSVNATFSKDAVKSAVKAMPDKYLRNRAAMVHFVSIDNETELRDTYANRQTQVGDANLQGALPLYVFGSQVKGAAMMPAANGIFSDPQNLIFGIQRNVMIEYDKDIRAREFIVVLTCRVAFQIEQEDACVKYLAIS